MRRLILILTAIMLVVPTLSPTVVFAQVDDTVHSDTYYTNNNIPFYHPELGEVPCEPGGGSTELVGGDNTEKAFNYFIGKGMTQEQSAGIVGNLKVESGGELDPAVQQFGGGPGRGIAQWEIGGRWDTDPLNYLKWTEYEYPLADPEVKRNPPKEPIDLLNQLDYLWYELQTTEKNAYDAVKATSTVEDAAAQFMLKFERPKDQSQAAQDERGRIAAEVLAQYGDSAGGGSAPPTSGSGCPETGGSAGIVDGLAFPLQTTKSVITSFDPSWCYQSLTNCHHDYNAADIFAPTGTTVIAAKPGTVIQVNNGQEANVTIKGEDNNIYYYTHMGAGTIKVNEGQAVTIAQQIGSVGTEADARGTPEHLHFDSLPPPHTGRVGCSAAACSGYPFINVQPTLVKSFEVLPE